MPPNISDQELADQNRSLLRLKEEFMQWRIDHPLGFYARPALVTDSPYRGDYTTQAFEFYGVTLYRDLRVWHCGIPGKSNTIMRNHYFDLTVSFPVAYPREPPIFEFAHPALKSVNFFQDPDILPFLSASHRWTPALTIPRILCGIQDALYKHKFMKMQPHQVRAFTRHCDSLLPFYPYCSIGGPITGFLITGQHSLEPELEDEEEE